MKVFDFEQRSEEWYKIRSKVPTASQFDKIITTKGEPSKQAEKYMYRLAGESISGVMEETYQSYDMLRGIELESEAREFFSFFTGKEVQKVGFCMSDNEKAGCSPDGLIGQEGVLEIKCPKMETHVSYKVNGGLSKEYWQQIQGELYVTDREWCYIISYYPNLPHYMELVYRDEEFIKKLDIEIKLFWDKLQKVIIKIGE